MAGWEYGGSAMSRSSSASTLPTDSSYDATSYYSASVERHIGPSHYSGSDYGSETGLSYEHTGRSDVYTDCIGHGPPALPAFYVLKQGQRAALPVNEPAAPEMRRSESMPAPLEYMSTSQAGGVMDDEQAAYLVEDHLACYPKDSKYERILRGLIYPRTRTSEDFEIDDDALDSIFSAANELFFHRRLRRRVKWNWSNTQDTSMPRDGATAASTALQGNSETIAGLTELRAARRGGFETRIKLSKRILTDKQYNRRLLISTFLHELIHSYLFVCCGYQAAEDGGHNVGFHRIAKLIDDWVGPDILHLHKMEAYLGDFETRHCHNSVYEDDGCGRMQPSYVPGPMAVRASIMDDRQAMYSNTGGPIYVYQSQRTYEGLQNPSGTCDFYQEVAHQR